MHLLPVSCRTRGGGKPSPQNDAPLLDTLPYGHFIFSDYPGVARVLAPMLAPLNSLYHLVPFGPFLILLGAQRGTARVQQREQTLG